MNVEGYNREMAEKKRVPLSLSPFRGTLEKLPGKRLTDAEVYRFLAITLPTPHHFQLGMGTGSFYY